MTRTVAWAAAYPRPDGPWTVRCGNRWGRLDPESATVDEVDPAADTRLPGLAPAMTEGSLSSYRIGRRAVVAASDSFVKIVRPGRMNALLERHALLDDGDRPFAVPSVLGSSTDGRVTLSPIFGSSLHHDIRSDPSRPLDAVGELVAALHDQPIPDWLPAKEPDDPGVWVAISRRLPTEHLPAIERTAVGLPVIEPRATVMVHGDLHDKNIFCGTTARRSAAFIDLDGLGRGAPEDDVANLAVHLELRNLQGRTGRAPGARSRELYRGYRGARPLDEDRLRSIEVHTWFRLACLYQYRATSCHLVPEFLRAASVDEREHHRHL